MRAHVRMRMCAPVALLRLDDVREVVPARDHSDTLNTNTHDAAPQAFNLGIVWRLNCMVTPQTEATLNFQTEKKKKKRVLEPVRSETAQSLGPMRETIQNPQRGQETGRISTLADPDLP